MAGAYDDLLGGIGGDATKGKAGGAYDDLLGDMAVPKERSAWDTVKEVGSALADAVQSKPRYDSRTGKPLREQEQPGLPKAGLGDDIAHDALRDLNPRMAQREDQQAAIGKRRSIYTAKLRELNPGASDAVIEGLVANNSDKWMPEPAQPEPSDVRRKRYQVNYMIQNPGATESDLRSGVSFDMRMNRTKPMLDPTGSGDEQRTQDIAASRVEDSSMGDIIAGSPKRALIHYKRGAGGLVTNAADWLGGDDLGLDAGSLSAIGRNTIKSYDEELARTAPRIKDPDSWKAASVSAVDSLVTQYIPMFASIASGNAMPALATMFGTEGGNRMADLQQKGYDKETVLRHGAMWGAAEAVPETFSIGALFKLLGAKGAQQAVTRFIESQVTEHGTEQATTIAEHFLQKSLDEPNRSMQDLWNDMQRTAKSVAIAAPLMSGGAVVAHGVVNGLRRDDPAERAKQEALDKWAAFGAHKARQDVVQEPAQPQQTQPAPVAQQPAPTKPVTRPPVEPAQGEGIAAEELLGQPEAETPNMARFGKLASGDLSDLDGQPSTLMQAGNVLLQAGALTQPAQLDRLEVDIQTVNGLGLDDNARQTALRGLVKKHLREGLESGRDDAVGGLDAGSRGQPGPVGTGSAGVELPLASDGRGNPADAGQPLAERGTAALVANGVPGDEALKTQIADAAHEAATSPLNDLPQPTQAQKEAGNYRKGHLTWNGLDIAIENPMGSERSGVDQNGQQWTVAMPGHYGYVKRTEGADGDQVDIYLGTKPDSGRVFVVDQIDADSGRFDEHKVVAGVETLGEAQALYDAGFSDGRGPQRRGAITEMSVEQFKDWLAKGNTKKPLAKPAPRARGTVIEDERLTQQADDLRALAGQAGWAEEGGKLMRDATTGDVIGRTPWVPRAPWFKGKPEKVTEKTIQSGLDKALAGKPLNKVERESVLFLLDVLDEQAQQQAKVDSANDSLQDEEFDHIPFDAPGETDLAAQMEALGFSQEEIDRATNEEGTVAGQAAQSERAGSPSGAQAGQRGAPAETAGAGEQHGRGPQSGGQAQEQPVAETADDGRVEALRPVITDLIRSKGSTKHRMALDALVSRLKRMMDGERADNDIPYLRGKIKTFADEQDVQAAIRQAIEAVKQAKSQPTAPQQETPALTSYSNQDIIEREAKAARAEKEAAKEPPAKNVTADQVDMFNTQESLFNSNREEPKAAESDKVSPRTAATDDARHGGPYTVDAGSADGRKTKYKVVEGAERGVFTVYSIPNSMGAGQIAMGTFRMNDAGRIIEIKPRWDWAREGVQQAADQFSAEQVGPGNKPAASANTIFTEDAAAKARALLKKKLNNLNTGIDPEVMLAGITLAGYHIEKGARTFAAYSKAMIDDIGEVAKPYLKAWYLGVKHYPGVTFAEEMDGEASVSAAELDPHPAAEQMIGEKPTAKRAPGHSEQYKNYRQWIEDGHEVPPGMVETIQADTRLNDGEAEELLALAEKNGATLNQNEGKPDDAGHLPEAGLPGQRGAGDQEPGRGGRRGGEPLDAGVAATGEGAAGGRGVPGSTQESGGSGTDGLRGSAGHDAPDTKGNRGSARPVDGAAESVDHSISDDDQIGKGGLATKYRDNVTAIKLIKTLEAENRVATPEERKQLARYVGWGALKGVFDYDNKSWAKQHKELRELLTDTEWESAMASVLNAHYTAPVVVKTMYQALDRLGFKGGRVLEPSMGSGNFFGLMPKDLRNASKLHGVELDNLTSRLARALYPNAVIAASTPFQHYQVPSGYFDVAIGNPPFGSEPIVDRERSDYSGWSIHNYFIARMIDKTRDGGIVPVIVSHSFMDALNARTREWVAERANLLGAVRLPYTAFLENAGTEVVTDILFFQKTATPEKNPAWVNASDLELTDDKSGTTGTVAVNDYFLANPRNVLGRHALTGSMYRADSYNVEPVGNADLEDQLTQFINSLPENVYQAIERPIEELEQADEVLPDGIKPGSYFVSDKGEVRQRGNDVAGMQVSRAWAVPNAMADKRMRAMIQLRDLLRAQMRMERSKDAPESAIESARRVLNKRYDEFVKEYGYLNSQTNRRLFMDDTEAALLQMLEPEYDPGVTRARAEANGLEPREPSAKKADILSQRALFPPPETINVTNAKDALLASLNEKGRIDPDHMLAVYPGKTWDEIAAELGEVMFNDPQNGYVAADEYLSGDVKTKLAEAQSAAQDDPKFARNVAALEKVQPADKLPSEIFASLGAHWIPVDVYRQFAKEVTGADVNLAYVAATAQWVSSLQSQGDAGLMRAEYGTDKINAFDILSLMLNGRAPEIKVRVGIGTVARYVTDEDATEAARQRMGKIQQKWDSWVWADGERADRLSGLYNEKHNRTVNRGYDGTHLTLPGKSPAITLRQHQFDFIWRSIQERNVLADHVVGAGKTFALIGTIMEMKRLGISRKPLFAVPNHLTLQWRSDFSRLYPAANVLAATPEDFSKDNRERMFAKIATGAYDAVVIGHSSLVKIGLDAEIEARMNQEQLDSIADAIEDMKRERGDRGIIRDMEKIKANLEAKIEKLKEKAGERDKVISFNELGIDALFVDELHEFKNLFFYTQKQRVSGLGNPSGSGKAFDLFMKIRWLQEAYGDRVPLVGATGTPVSNSLAEMYTMQRLMRYPELKRDGLHLFDAWSRMFGQDEHVYEVAPSGVGYRISQRFSKFKNLPALMGHYQSFADVVTLQDLKDNAKKEGKRFPVPKMEGGRQQNIVAQRSDMQRDFFGVPVVRRDEAGKTVFTINDPASATITENKDAKDERTRFILKSAEGTGYYATQEQAEMALVESAMTPVLDLDPKSLVGQFNNLAALTRSSKGKINALSLTGLANKAGLDFRLINPSAPDFEGSKINKAVDRMMEKYHQWAKDKGTQLVFSDLSVPLSARAAAAQTEKRLYVLDADGLMTHKKGTLHTIDGLEGFPFYLIKRAKTKKQEASVSVYEPVSGQLLHAGFSDKGAAKKWVEQEISTDAGQDKWLTMRDSVEPMSPERIAEYRDEHDLEVAEDGSNELSMDDLEAMSGAGGFSVYDDIKAKLMARGVPEHEIAFIHDFDTPKKKAELFKQTNKGMVRFLFGSTPKLGAGTNVQERLVALHHIDAPWRPSDLEQREGRIIRQGNKLYERDPDGFEVFIGRYATEQTYDTRRWQLLEHKAAGIEQLRKYSGEAEIDDVASEAANAADMKAAASGNPLILEETQLRNEVKRLTALRRAHEDGKVALARKIKHLRNTISTFLPERLKEIAAQQAIADKNPIPKEKGSIPAIEVEGKRANDREQAESLIGKLIAKVRVGGMFVGSNPTVTYRGVKFTVEQNRGAGVDVLHAYGTLVSYGPTETISSSGLLTRMGNLLERFDADRRHYEALLENNKAELAGLEAHADDRFDGEQDLADTTARHAVIQRKLMKSTQLDAVPPEQRAAFEQELKDRRTALEKLGYGKAVKESTQDDPAALSLARGENFSPLGVGIAQATIDRIGAVFAQEGGNVDIRLAATFDALPPQVKAAIRKYGKDTKVRGVVHKGVIHVVADEHGSEADLETTILHEAIGHVGVRRLFGREITGKLGDLFVAIGGGKGLSKIAQARGLTADLTEYAKMLGESEFTDEVRTRIMMEEVLAHIAEAPKFADRVKSVMGAVRAWLRKHGFAKLAEYGETDLLHIVSQARKALTTIQTEDGPAALMVAYHGSPHDFDQFSRAYRKTPGTVGDGMTLRDLKAHVANLTRGYKNLPPITELQAVADAPREVREAIDKEGASGDVEGLYFNGHIYLFADNLPDAHRAEHVLIQHELAHYGFRGVFGAQLDPLLHDIWMRNLKVQAKAAALKQQFGYESNVLATEEVLADMVPGELVKLKGWDKLVLAVRDWLRTHGFTRMADAIERGLEKKHGEQGLADLEVSRIVRAAREWAKTGKRNVNPLAGVRFGKDGTWADVIRAWRTIAQDEAAFQRPTPDSFDMAESAREIDPGMQAFEDTPDEDERRDAKIVRKWLVKMPDGTLAKVYENGQNEVWINAANLAEGVSGGTKLYLLAGSYADANGKVFIGDPAGLSDVALLRRTENMLSLALRFERTDFIMPHEYQMNPDAKLDTVLKDVVRPLEWVVGDDQNNLGELLKTSYANTVKLYPEIKRVTYNFDKQRFEHDGEEFTDFSGILSRGNGILRQRGLAKILSSRKPGAAGGEAQDQSPVGSTTLKRAAITNTVVRAAGGAARGDVLARIGAIVSGGLSTTPLRKILYSRKPNAGAPVQSSLPGMPPNFTPPPPPIQPTLGMTGGQSGPNSTWDSPEDSKLDDVIYKLQDKNIDLKRALDGIRAAGRDIADKWDAYLQEGLFHGRAATRTEHFVDMELRPLLVRMKARELSIADLDAYLHARHAKEANALIASRDPNMQDGGSGMTDREADDYLNNLDPAKKKRLEATAKEVDDIIAATRELYVSYGLESRDVVDSWASMFQHYVPLMREDHDGGMGIGQGFSIRGKEAKHRTGSTAKVVDILANIALQREKAIVRGEKNRVAVSLAGLVKLNPNPDFWKFDQVPTERVLNEKTGLVETRVDPLYKSRPNIIIAKIADGKGGVQERAVIFNERNDRAMRLAESMKNLDVAQLEGLLGVSSKVTRYFASINTQYNPVFGVKNLLRDVQFAGLALTSTPLAKHKARVMAQVPSALKGIYQDARAERAGKEATSAWAQLWEEFTAEGGQTGFRELFKTSADRAKKIEHELNPYGWMEGFWGKGVTLGGAAKLPAKAVQKGGGIVFDWLSDYNLAMENAVRLSAYKVAREQGMSKQRAAMLAKTLTVNFNRKGQMTQQVGALYAFFNASVQGTARLAETLKGPAGKQIVAGGVLLGVVQALALAFAGFDDDEPPEFVKEKNLIIPIGDRKYLSLPMPLGFHVLPNLGRVATEYTLGGFRNGIAHTTDMIGILAEAFNPIGSAGLSYQTLSPTAMDPLVALSENRDWTGKPIALEDRSSLAPTPGHSRTKDTASSTAKWLSWAINAATGGTDYTPGKISPTPDQLDYLWGQATGGVGRETSKMAQTISAAVTGEDLPTHKIPLLGAMYGDANSPSAQRGKFYDNVRRINLAEAEVKGRIKDGIDPDAWAAKNPDAQLIGLANAADNTVRKLNSAKRKMLAAGAPRAEVKEIEGRIAEVMGNLNRAVSEQDHRP